MKKHKSTIKLNVFRVAVAGSVLAIWIIWSVISSVTPYFYSPKDPQLKYAADAIALSSEGKKALFDSGATLLPYSELAVKCDFTGEVEVVEYGCFDRTKIYVLNIPSGVLKNHTSTTLAHELLHYQYGELSDSARNEINNELMQLIPTRIEDTDIETRLREVYRFNQTNQDYFDELYSIVGTEIPSVSPALESHYRKYFSDRNKIVDIQKEVDRKIKNIELDLTKSENQLTQIYSRIDSLKASIDDFEARLNYDYRRDPYNYNRNVPTFNRMVDEYNALLEEANDSYSEYEKELDAYNGLFENLKKDAPNSQTIGQSN